MTSRCMYDALMFCDTPSIKLGKCVEKAPLTLGKKASVGQNYVIWKTETSGDKIENIGIS